MEIRANNLNHKYNKYKTKYINNKNILMHGGNLSVSLKKMISGWISIQNITAEKEFGKTYLEKMNFGQVDLCEQIKLDDCDKQTELKCKTYTNSAKISTCVSQDRIRKFTSYEMMVWFNGYDNEKYGIAYSMLLNINPIRDFGYLSEQIYCYMITPQKINMDGSRTLYVLFNTGEVFNSDLLYSEKLQTEFKKICDTIISLHKHSSSRVSVIFCGHSMGSVMACLCGKYMIENNIDFFREHCYIFGSGMYEWMMESDRHIFETHIDKIQLFILMQDSEKIETDGIVTEKYYIDSKFFLNDRGLTHLFPINVLKKDYGSVSKIVNNSDKLTDAKNKYNDDELIENLHNWSYYFNAIHEYLLS